MSKIRCESLLLAELQTLLEFVNLYPLIPPVAQALRRPLNFQTIVFLTDIRQLKMNLEGNRRANLRQSQLFVLLVRHLRIRQH
jgi:hypothetical protein